LRDNAYVFGGMKQRIPILIYHGFYQREDEISSVSSAERRYFLSTDSFTLQVKRLAELNYSISSVEKVSGPRGVSFTFDDGHISNYSHVFPLLAEHGFSGTFFIVADWIGRAGRIDIPQLREMNSQGMAIGSHGFSHVSLAGLSREALDRELAGSKERLEQVLGTEVTTLALPRGLMDRQVLERARAAGYRRVCTSNAGLMNGEYAAPRLSITSHTSLQTIEGYARRDSLLIARTRAAHAARLTVKSVVGVANYEALCRSLLRTP
jgi:peptidoglycan/xylan/chitin deacetylase (PgdA/CDA1 family)